MLVKTRLGALISGTILAAILLVIIAGDGGPPRHIVNLPKPVMAPQRLYGPDDYVPSPPPSFAYVGRQPTVDDYFLAGLRGGVVYFGLFLSLHLVLRRFGNARRWSYAAIGALAFAGAAASLTHPQAWSVLFARGVISWYAASALFLGAIIGFGYYRTAGLEAAGDDPERLAEAVTRASEGPPPEGTPQAQQPAYVQTQTTEYFDGPLRVRTVLPIALVAALLSAGIFAMIRMSMGALPELQAHLTQGHLPLYQAVALSLESQTLTLVVMGIAAPFPFAAVVVLSHLILRAWGKTSPLAYMAIGAAAPVTVSLLLGPVGLFFGLQAIIPMVMAMTLYRNMAGLEPAPVKEDIILNDRRNLVSENHPRRQFGRIIQS